MLCNRKRKHNKHDKGTNTSTANNQQDGFSDYDGRREYFPRYRDEVLHQYQGYGMISHPTFTRNYPENCLEGGGDEIPTQCQLNLTIVNRGEFDGKPTVADNKVVRPDSPPYEPSFDRFRQYMDEMKQYYQQQQAYLQEQNAQCFQQLLQLVQQQQMQQQQIQQQQMQQQQTRVPPAPQEPLPIGSHSFRYYKPTSSNTPARQPPPPRYQPPPTPPPPPPPNDDVLYEDVVNGTRITISESPRSGASGNEPLSPILQLNITKSHGNLPSNTRDRCARAGFTTTEETHYEDLSEGEPVPQVNLFVTVAPPAPGPAPGAGLGPAPVVTNDDQQFQPEFEEFQPTKRRKNRKWYL